MSRVLSEERIPARMPTAVYERVTEAAQLVGATLNQFLVQSALEKADEIIERERVITLSKTAAQIVFDLIKNPPEPNERVKKAALKYRETILCSK